MVLEHLTIVGRRVTHLLAEMATGRDLPRVLRTQDVKPQGGLTRAQSVSDFESMVRDYLTRARSTPHSSRARHQHPFFGSLSCRQWVAFMTLHHMVHLPQMKAIRAAVAAPPSTPPPPRRRCSSFWGHNSALRCCRDVPFLETVAGP